MDMQTLGSQALWRLHWQTVGTPQTVQPAGEVWVSCCHQMCVSPVSPMCVSRLTPAGGGETAATLLEDVLSNGERLDRILANSAKLQTLDTLQVRERVHRSRGGGGALTAPRWSRLPHREYKDFTICRLISFSVSVLTNRTTME